jgi:hypothetical protein
MDGKYMLHRKCSFPIPKSQGIQNDIHGEREYPNPPSLYHFKCIEERAQQHI